MAKLGGYLLFFGLGSMVLSFMGYEFVILSWIDSWGTEAGWGIRIAMAVGGGLMWLLGRSKQAEA
jgi:hypothetical protein